jgi:hypothetical protein
MLLLGRDRMQYQSVCCVLCLDMGCMLGGFRFPHIAWRPLRLQIYMLVGYLLQSGVQPVRPSPAVLRLFLRQGQWAMRSRV